MKILLSEHFLKKGIYININSPSVITITKIDLSEDLRYAKVFFTSMLDDEDRVDIEDHLNQNANSYKYIIGKKIRTKNIPNFRFVYDNVFATKFKADI